MQTEPRAALCVDRVRACRAAFYLLVSLLGGDAADTAVADAGATDAGAGVSPGAPYNLAEVVVTSRRREETLQDVPLAETVRSGADLEQQSAVLFEDAVQDVPNTLAFKSARSVSALEITMRGQTAIPSSIVYDPAVGLYINGVYVAEGQGLGVRALVRPSVVGYVDVGHGSEGFVAFSGINYPF
jgi:outer membrane receptor protein involved in Fe transport